MKNIGAIGSLYVPVLRSRRVGGTALFEVLDDAAIALAAPSPAGAVEIHGLLGLQEAAGDAGADRAARSHADSMLAGLAGLQQALLSGSDGAAALARLAEMGRRAPPAADPRLRALVGAISLRAAVELARRSAPGIAAQK